jgi:hypothetical protein
MASMWGDDHAIGDLHVRGASLGRRLAAAAHSAGRIGGDTPIPGNREDRVIQFLIGIWALGLSYQPALAADPLTGTEQTAPSLMRFEWHTEAPPDQCGPTCHTWVSATGVITPETAHDFDQFAEDNHLQGATLALDSEGGSVVAALALGRAIRRFDMTTTVGKTIVLASDNGTPRAKLSPSASCESMCAFLLLGGARRYVPPEARVLVHMIWPGNRRESAREASYTADELGLVQHDIGAIARYTVEMGGSIELLETALRIPPWKPMYALAPDEVHRMRLTNLESEGDMFLITAQAPWQATPAAAGSKALPTVAQSRRASD